MHTLTTGVRTVGILLITTWLAFHAACSNDPGLAIGENCTTHTECASGQCVAVPMAGRSLLVSICVESCIQGAPCPEDTVCAMFTQAGALCVPRCSDDFESYNASAVDRYACVDGTPTQCSQLPYGSECRVCGCNPGDYCNYDAEFMLIAEQACLPVGAQGDACEHDLGCTTGNCGIASNGTTQQCLVSIGAPCTDDNCQLCSQGGAFCSRRCSGEYGDCPYPHSPRLICTGYSDTNYYTCNVDCGVGQCGPYDDPWNCSPDPSRCPAGQVCEALSSNGYHCDW